MGLTIILPPILGITTHPQILTMNTFASVLLVAVLVAGASAQCQLTCKQSCEGLATFVIGEQLSAFFDMSCQAACGGACTCMNTCLDSCLTSAVCLAGCPVQCNVQVTTHALQVLSQQYNA